MSKEKVMKGEDAKPLKKKNIGKFTRLIILNVILWTAILWWFDIGPFYSDAEREQDRIEKLAYEQEKREREERELKALEKELERFGANPCNSGLRLSKTFGVWYIDCSYVKCDKLSRLPSATRLQIQPVINELEAADIDSITMNELARASGFCG